MATSRGNLGNYGDPGRGVMDHVQTLNPDLFSISSFAESHYKLAKLFYPVQHCTPVIASVK